MEFQLISIASPMLAAAVWSEVPCLRFFPFAFVVLSGLLGGWLPPLALVSIAAFGAAVLLHGEA